MSFAINTQDVLTIEAIDTNYLLRLNEILKETVSIKGVSAYWTLEYDAANNSSPYSEYCNGFYELLSKQESFMCVDLHFPTNIDHITSATNGGCNFYMFAYEGKGGEYHEYNRLLHSKLIIFEGQSVDYVLLGSHNQTGPATKGLNKEFSLILKINSDSDMKKKLIDYLEFIQGLCIALPKNHLKQWMLKLVQTKGKLDWIKNVNYIECTVLKKNTYDSIKVGTLIHLISFSKIGDAELSKINDIFCLSVQTNDGTKRKYLKVKVDKSSNVDEHIKKASTGQSFDKRHYMYHGLHEEHSNVTPSVIFPVKTLDSNYFQDNKFNLELHVIEDLQSIRKSGDLSISIDMWKDVPPESNDLLLFLNQFDYVTKQERKEHSYESIRIIDKELLRRVFTAENEELFKHEYGNMVIENLGEEIPYYQVSDHYLSMFKEIDKFISTSKLQKGKPKKNVVKTEFERLYKIYGSSENLKNGQGALKSKKVDKRHKFINRGIALTKCE
jgi:hypothetical protein